MPAVEDQIAEDEPVVCPRCGWSGFGKDLDLEMFQEVAEVNCPECGKRIHLLSFS